MQEKDRGVDFVGIEQRALQRVHIPCVPGIAVCACQSTIGVSPVTFAPIAGDVADSGMRDGGGKDIRFCLQVLCHEATVGCPYATDLFSVDKVVFGTEFLCSFDDLVSCTLSPCIYVAGGELLAEAGCSAGLDDINDVAQCRIYVRRIPVFE